MQFRHIRTRTAIGRRRLSDALRKDIDGIFLRRAENPLLRWCVVAVRYVPHALRASFRRNISFCNLPSAAFLHGQDPQRTSGPLRCVHDAGSNQSDHQDAIQHFCRDCIARRPDCNIFPNWLRDVTIDWNQYSYEAYASCGFRRNINGHPNDTHDASVFNINCGRAGIGSCSGARTFPKRSSVRRVRITPSGLGL
jgi:hypothetical protein